MLPAVLIGSILLFGGNLGPAPALVTVAPNHPSLQYTGRWDFSQPLQPWCAWQGSTLTFAFDGVAVAARLDPGPHREWFRVVVDGVQEGARKLEVAPGAQEVVLASGLPPGRHRIDLVKETYLGGDCRFLGLLIRGQGMAPAPPRPPHRIEFYGDSNLAGESNESERDPGDQDLIGVHFGLAGILSRRLQAEYHNIATSGETLSGLLRRYDRMHRGSDLPPWDFQRFQPDVVVINIGANDIWFPWRTEAAMRADYFTLLNRLRLVHPNAFLVLANARGWDFNEPANFIEDVAASYGDPKVSACVFPWLFEVFHGCQSDQAGMADYLAEHIAGLTGWSPLPSDVVVGFGRGGDVANGSFEGIAPFGGFAWRYMDDARVERLENPQAAQDGDAFIRLRQGASIQQTNPAKDGDRVLVSLWLRGHGQARLSLDFRDQEIYSAPMQAKSQVVTLGTAWQEVRFWSRALPTPRPVYRVRLTVAAGPGSVVEVDHIRQATL